MTTILAIEVNGKSTNDKFSTKNIWENYEGVIFHIQVPTNLENEAFSEEKDGRIALLITSDTNCCEDFGVKVRGNENLAGVTPKSNYISDETFEKLLGPFLDAEIKNVSSRLGGDDMDEGGSYIVKFEFFNKDPLEVEVYNNHNGYYAHTVKLVLPFGIFTGRL